MIWNDTTSGGCTYGKSLIKEYNIGGIVLGLPISLNGQENQRTIKTRKFAENLYKNTQVDIVLYDERFSTSAIIKEMRKASISNKKIRKYIDKSSAAYILQGFLDKFKYN